MELGTAGGESLAGEGGADVILGGAGNDTLSGGLGIDIIAGEEGDDRIEGGGFDRLPGGAGNDTFVWTIVRHFANDRVGDFAAGGRLDFSAFGFSWIGDDSFTGAGLEMRHRNAPVDGAAATEIVVDLDGDTLVDAPIVLMGRHRLRETAPGSRIVTLAQNQSWTGTAGADTFDGAAGNDTLRAGAGNDTLSGGAGNDGMEGGAGNDLFLAEGWRDNSQLGFEMGNDTIRAASLADIEPIGMSMAYENIFGMAAYDRLDLLAITNLTYVGTGAFASVAGQTRQTVS
jgi:Ca2+-binding RTX toxin-like protein